MTGTNAILVTFKGENEKNLKTVSISEPKHIHQHLIDACLQNNAEAQRKLYDLYCAAVFNTCKRMLANRDDAQDVLQESFIDAFKGISNFNGKATFGAWLKRIAVNKCIDHLHRRKRLHFETMPQNQDAEDETFESQSNEQHFSIEEINAAILNLPDGCRTVFVLKAMEDFEHKEIAAEMNISIGTSKSQYNRAKELLRETLLKNQL